MTAKEVEEKEDEKINLDTILIEDVGQFGWYQFTNILLITLPVILSSCGIGEYVFTTDRIPTRCHIPSCDDDNPEFSADWIANAIPSTGSGFDNCARFANITNSNITTSCTADLFNGSHIIECEHYIYENTNSIVYDFDLACKEWKRSQIGSYRFLGNMLVMPFTGYLSDRFGRRVALIINTFNSGVFGLGRAYASSYEWFLSLGFLEMATGGGVFSSCYILGMELVGPKYRVIVGTAIKTIFAIGQIVLGAVASQIPQWRNLTLVIYAPQLLALVFFSWLASESVRWLMSKGRYKEAEVILLKVAKKNKKELSPNSLRMLRASIENEKKTETVTDSFWIIRILKSKEMLKRCLISPVWHMTNTFIYYGMALNAVHLSGNKYVNYMVVYAMDIPGLLAVVLLLDRVGRKPVLLYGFLLCGICQFTFSFVSTDNLALYLSTYLIGKCVISMTSISTFVYTSELMPTKHRHSLFSFLYMMGRLGNIAAPLIPALEQEVWEHLPSVLFGSMSLLSAFLTLLMPETQGTRLPDTIEQAENIGLQHTETTPASPATDCQNTTSTSN